MRSNFELSQRLSLSLSEACKEYVFSLPDRHVWCGAIEKAPDGRWFMAYSHWPFAYGHDAWATHSQIGLAVSDSIMGPYQPFKPHFSSSPHLPPVQHNPVMLRRGDRYFLYFMGNTGPWSRDNPPSTCGIGMHLPEWWEQRNNQRVYLAQSTDPLGDWEVLEGPLFEPDPGFVLTTTPYVFERLDGRIQVVIKTVRHNGQMQGGNVEHHIYLGDEPTGSFEKISSSLLAGMKTKFPLDDHCEFCYGDRYYAIVKDHGEGLTETVPALLLLESNDGHDWRLSEDPLVTPFHVKWEDGAVSEYERLEMPRVLFQDGQPYALQLSAWAGGDAKSFNLRVPLIIGSGQRKQ